MKNTRTFTAEEIETMRNVMAKGISAKLIARILHTSEKIVLRELAANQ